MNYSLFFISQDQTRPRIHDSKIIGFLLQRTQLSSSLIDSWEPGTLVLITAVISHTRPSTIFLSATFQPVRNQKQFVQLLSTRSNSRFLFDPPSSTSSINLYPQKHTSCKHHQLITCTTRDVKPETRSLSSMARDQNSEECLEM